MKSSKAAETRPEPEVATPNNLRKEASWRTQEAKARARREAEFGPTTPLAELAGVEEELRCHSKARDALSSETRRSADAVLLANQLIQVLQPESVSRTLRDRLVKDAIAAFEALQPRDQIESILVRHIIALSFGALEFQARAMRTRIICADTYLRHVEKLTRLLIKLIETLERRRGPGLYVGNVNVEGHAIIGNVETHISKSDNDVK